MKICSICKVNKDLSMFYSKKGKKCRSECKQCSSEISLKYRKENKEYIALQKKDYAANNMHTIRSYRRKYEEERAQKDENFKLRKRIRSRTLSILKKNKNLSTLELLGCTVDELKNHLLKTLDEENIQNNLNKSKNDFNWFSDMTFYTYHIDHIRPCSSFDLTNLEEQKECFNYTNLQLLWWKDNLEKSNKII